MKRLCNIFLVAAFAFFLSGDADAIRHGSQPVNNSRVNINFPNGLIYNNIVKSCGFGLDPAQQTPLGYPIDGTFGTGIGGQCAFPPNYYGTWTVSWTGIGALDLQGVPTIVVHGGASVQGVQPADSGTTNGNFAIAPDVGSGGIANPTVVLSFGYNIQSISDSGIPNGLGTGNLIQINTQTNYVPNGGCSPTCQGPSVQISGTAISALNGTITTTTLYGSSPSSFTLDGSVFTTPQAGVQGTAVVGGITEAADFPSGQTFSSFNNFVISKTSSVASITAGLLTDDLLVQQLQYLFNTGSPLSHGNPGSLRFMDVSAVQGSYESDFANRMSVNQMTYNPSRWVTGTNGYWAGAITNTGGDAYQMQNAPFSVNTLGLTGAAPYQDNEIFQGALSSTNLTGNPTLEVFNGATSRGKFPIFHPETYPLLTLLGGPAPSGGQTINATFKALWLNGASGLNTNYVVPYTTSAGATFTLSASGTTTATITVLTGTLAAGQTLLSTPSGLFGAQPWTAIVQQLTGPTGGSGTYQTSAALTASGVSGFVLDDTDVTNGESNLSFALSNLFANDLTLNGTNGLNLNKSTVQISNPGTGPVFYLPTPQTGFLTVSYSGAGVPSGTDVIRVYKNHMGADQNTLVFGNGNQNVTFIYNKLLQGFIWNVSGLSSNIPFEIEVDVANRSFADVHWNWGITKSGWVTAVTNFFATNLKQGLKFNTEVGNELWNFGANPYWQYISTGAAMGWNIITGEAFHSVGGLRSIQYAQLSRAAWASAGRAANDHYVLQESQVGDFTSPGANGDRTQLQGGSLNTTTFPLYGLYGQLNGIGTIPTGSSGYNVAPNRPVDNSDCIGEAPYWGSLWWGGESGFNTGEAGSIILGTVSGNSPWLQAQLDFANGSFTTAYNGLVQQFTGNPLARSDGKPNQAASLGLLSPFTAYYGNFVATENVAASYDVYRQSTLGKNRLCIWHYEGGPQWSTGNSGINGVNSVNNIDTASMANQLAFLSTNPSSEIGDLSWLDLSAYTLTGKPTVVSGGTTGYNSGTGLVTLDLSKAIAFGAASVSTTGTVSGNTYTPGSGLSGVVAPGQTVIGAGIAGGTLIQQGMTFFGTSKSWFLSTAPGTIGPETISTGDTVVVALTGTNVSSLNGTFVAASLAGTTLTYTAPTGISGVSITGGTVYDRTAAFWEVAHNTMVMQQAWKNDPSYASMIATNYYQMLYLISGKNREVHGAQYGYSGSQWGLFPGDYHFSNPYQNYEAIHQWNQ